MKKSFFEKIVGLDGVYRLVLNRPEKLNAFSAELLDGLISDLKELQLLAEKLECRVLLVESKAAPKAFCAGADLEERSKTSEAEVSAALKKLRELMGGVESLSCPTIAVIDGIAFGGGFELALACDLRVATPTSRMGLTEVKLGIIPGAGGTQRLSRLVGISKAKELIFSARSITAAEALSLGILNAVDPAANAAAQKLAESFLSAAPLALPAAKLAIQKAWDLDLEAGLNFERSCYDRVLKSEDRVEGLRAFMEKRKAVYKGN